MQSSSVRVLLNEALSTVGGGGAKELATYFSDDCSFVVPGSPYRIDGLESFVGASANFKEMEGTHLYVDVRQLQVVELGDTFVACGHLVSRYSIAGRTIALGGKCTAVVSGGKIVHLHVSNNIGSESGHSGSAGANGVQATDHDLSASQLRLMRWGSEEFGT